MIGRTEYILMHTTREGFQILVTSGKKGKFDYKILYRKPSKTARNGFTRTRTPKHIHVIVELYAKLGASPKLTLELREYFLELFSKVKAVHYYPPSLLFFRPSKAKKYKKLDRFGEFSSEFLMVFVELLLIQEKTNYSRMEISEKLFRHFAKHEVFSVVSIATVGKLGRR